MRNIKRNFVFFLLILLMVSFCSINAFGEKSTRVNLLGYLKYAVKFETKRPYYLKKARRLFFKEGWDTVGPYPRAIRRGSFIEFYSSSKKKIKMSISIENNNFLRMKNPLNIDLYLNQIIIKNLEIKSLYSCILELPAELINKGINKLKFSIQSKTPTRVKDSNSFPGVWFLLKNFSFIDIPDIGTDFVRLNDSKLDRFYQPSNSNFVIAIDSNKIASVEFSSNLLKKNDKNESLIVKKIFRNGLSKVLFRQKPLFGKSFQKKLNLKKTKGKFLLEFSFSSPSNRSLLVWNKFNFIRCKGKKKKVNLKTKRLKNLKNIFVIVLDAFRYDLVNKKVNGKEVTPNINEFSNLSYNFQNFYANAPYTGPSVATMFTGFLPEIHGVRKIGNLMPDEIKTLQFYLKKKDYLSQAFTGNPVLLSHELLKKFDNKKLIFRTVKKEKKNSSYNNIKPILNSISKLKKMEKNFFYIHLLPPHKPYNPPESFKKKFYIGSEIKNNGFDTYAKEYINYKYLRYLNNVNYGDHLVGQILTAINNAGIFEESLIIITSDHGEAFAEHNDMEHSKSVYNEMIHISFLLKLPFQKEKIKLDSFCSHLSFTPTIVRFLGLKKNENWQGSSLFLNNNDNNFQLYSRAEGEEFNSSIILKKYKYIFNSGMETLFNIEQDDRETKNIAGTFPFIRLFLKQQVFLTYLENRIKRKRMGIKFSRKKTKSWNNKLKTLGYL